MIKSGTETPNTRKRERERENLYNGIKRGISGKIPQALIVECVKPLGDIQWKPNRKFQILCNDIRNSEGDGDQILATLEMQ